jgi:hypothetical protein
MISIKSSMQDAFFLVYQRTSTLKATTMVSTGSPDQSHQTARFLRGWSGDSISAENGEPKRLEEMGEEMMKVGGEDGRGDFILGGRARMGRRQKQKGLPGWR